MPNMTIKLFTNNAKLVPTFFEAEVEILTFSDLHTAHKIVIILLLFWAFNYLFLHCHL